MLIDCTHCQARVNAAILELAPYRDFEEWTNSYRLALLRCPECKHPLVCEQSVLKLGEIDFDGSLNVDNEKWLPPSRVWPEPVPQILESSIPETIRTCLLEARKCL